MEDRDIFRGLLHICGLTPLFRRFRHLSIAPEYRIPRLAVYDYGHSCEKGFSPFRETPFSVAESGSIPLGVSRLPFPQQLPALPSRLFLKLGIENNEIYQYELSPNFWEPQVERELLCVLCRAPLRCFLTFFGRRLSGLEGGLSDHHSRLWLWLWP